MIQFLKNIFLKDKPESSKRFFGAISLLCATFVICIFQQQMVDKLLYTSAALLGLGIFDNLKNKL